MAGMSSSGGISASQGYNAKDVALTNAEVEKANAASRAAAAQQAAVDENKRQRDQLLKFLGLNPNGSLAGGGILGSIDAVDPRVGWIDGENRANRDIQRNLVNQMGVAQRTQINRDWDAATGTALGRLEARGLGSSNLGTSTIAATQEGRQQNLLNLEEGLLGAKLGVERDTNASITGAFQKELERQQQNKQLKLGYSNLLGS